MPQEVSPAWIRYAGLPGAFGDGSDGDERVDQALEGDQPALAAPPRQPKLVRPRPQRDADLEIRQHNGHTRYERMMEDGRQIVVIMDEATRTVKTAWWNKRGSRRRRRR